MTCQAFEQRLQLLLDSRLTPQHDAALRSHAETCELCRERLAAQQVLFSVLRQRVVQPASLATHVMSSLPTRLNTAPATRGRWSWSAGLVGVACAGLACAWWSPALPNPLPRANPRIPTAITTNVAAPNAEVRQAEVAMPTITNLASNETLSANESLSAHETLGVYREAFESIATKIHSSSLEEVQATLEPGLNPIRSSFGLTLDALRRTLPRGKEERAARPPHGAFLSPEITLYS